MIKYFRRTFEPAVLLQTLYVISHAAFILPGVYELTNSPEHRRESWWLRLLLVILSVKCLLFFILVWIGLILKGSRKCLGIWLLLGIFLDFAFLLIFLTGVSRTKPVNSTLSLHFLLKWIGSWPILVIDLLFQAIIYSVTWTELSRGQQIVLFKNHDLSNIKKLERFVRTILRVQILWSLISIVVIDWSMEVAIQQFIQISEPEISSPLRPSLTMKVIRVLVSFLALLFLRKGRMRYLKYAWLPLHLSLMEVVALTPIFIMTRSTSKHRVVPCFLETVTCLVMDLVLCYSIVRILVERAAKSIMPAHSFVV